MAARSVCRTRKITGGWAAALVASKQANRQTERRLNIVATDCLTINAKSLRVIWLFSARLSFGRCLPQQVLDLTIHTPQLVGGPFFQLLPQIGREPEHEWV